MTREAELQGPRLRGTGDRAVCTPRPRSGWRSDCCCRRRPRWAPTPIRTGRSSTAGRRSPTGCWNWPAMPRRARTTSWRSSTRCARRCCRRGHVAVLADAAGRRPGGGGPAGPGDRHRPALAHRHRAGRRRATSTRDGPETPFIDAEAQRDPTAAGRRTAPRPRRRAPQAAVKDAAWQQVIEDDTIANITARAIMTRVRRSRARASCCSRSPRSTSTRSRGLGAAVQRGRADRRDRAVPVLGHQRGGPRRRRRVPGRPGLRCRPRCAGWCSRAAPASSGRCGRARIRLPAELGRRVQRVVRVAAVGQAPRPHRAVRLARARARGHVPAAIGRHAHGSRGPGAARAARPWCSTQSRSRPLDQAASHRCVNDHGMPRTACDGWPTAEPMTARCSGTA